MAQGVFLLFQTCAPLIEANYRSSSLDVELREVQGQAGTLAEEPAMKRKNARAVAAHSGDLRGKLRREDLAG